MFRSSLVGHACHTSCLIPAQSAFYTSSSGKSLHCTTGFFHSRGEKWPSWPGRLWALSSHHMLPFWLFSLFIVSTRTQDSVKECGIQAHWCSLNSSGKVCLCFCAERHTIKDNFERLRPTQPHFICIKKYLTRGTTPALVFKGRRDHLVWSHLCDYALGTKTASSQRTCSKPETGIFLFYSFAEHWMSLVKANLKDTGGYTREAGAADGWSYSICLWSIWRYT